MQNKRHYPKGTWQNHIPANHLRNLWRELNNNNDNDNDNKMTTKNCLECNQPFAISQQHKKLCSDACYMEHRKKDNRKYMRSYIKRPHIRKKRNLRNKKYKQAWLERSKELSRRYQTESDPAESFSEFRARIKSMTTIITRG